MIIETVKEMVWFLMIVILAVAGFGNTYLVIMRNEEVVPGDHLWFKTQALSWA